MEHPEVPLEQAQEEIHHRAHETEERWVMGVALSAAILAALAAVTALVAEHHADEALICQIQSADQWGYYQAKSLKWNLLTTKGELLDALGRSAVSEDQARLKKYEREQEEIKEKAEHLQAESEEHLRHHAVLARSLTLFQVAIAVAAISALTRKRAFWLVSLGFGVAGLGLFVWGVVV